jgi:hypothetical protein
MRFIFITTILIIIIKLFNIFNFNWLYVFLPTLIWLLIVVILIIKKTILKLNKH